MFKTSRHNFKRNTGYSRVRFSGRAVPSLDLVSLRRECVIDEALMLEIKLLEDMLSVPRNFLGRRLNSTDNEEGTKRKNRSKVS